MLRIDSLPDSVGIRQQVLFQNSFRDEYALFGDIHDTLHTLVHSPLVWYLVDDDESVKLFGNHGTVAS